MIYPIQNIVAGIADLDSSDPVLSEAVELAHRTGARLHLVHGFELPALAWDAYGRMGYLDTQTLDRYAESLRERLRIAAGEKLADGRVRTHAIAGPAAMAVGEVAVAERADLIIVGATRQGPVARVLLGTTAQRVLRAAAVPVLVLREKLPAKLDRLMLTTDLSPFSAGVHELGLDVLDSLLGFEDAEVRSLLVVRSSMGLPARFRFDQLEEISRTELRKFIDLRRQRGVSVSGVVRFGEPAEEITAEANEWKPDLVVVGTHSRKATERWLLGSVAESAIRSIEGNVLVVPAKAAEQRNLPVRREPAAMAGVDQSY